jgi:hypothetical protein
MNYYVSAVLTVLGGAALDASDKYSFNHPPITCKEDWEKLLDKTWIEAQQLAILIEQFPEEKLNGYFAEEKYGSYYRNFHGIIEHIHYHTGQVVIIKKLLSQTGEH